jgi:hypothetical protein
MDIAILEDDDRRIDRMRAVLKSICPWHGTHVFGRAPDMIGWLRENLGRLALISLDHDLLPRLDDAGPSRPPGNGMDVAGFLAGQPPACPVILHTSNYFAAPAMEEVLARAGWNVKRIVPFWDLEWIDSAWGVAVEMKLTPLRASEGRPQA